MSHRNLLTCVEKIFFFIIKLYKFRYKNIYFQRHFKQSYSFLNNSKNIEKKVIKKSIQKFKTFFYDLFSIIK